MPGDSKTKKVEEEEEDTQWVARENREHGESGTQHTNTPEKKHTEGFAYSSMEQRWGKRGEDERVCTRESNTDAGTTGGSQPRPCVGVDVCATREKQWRISAARLRRERQRGKVSGQTSRAHVGGSHIELQRGELGVETGAEE